ncbi:hypothetical protein GH714_007849 [Hevea brasiliensis]|uniref:Uncharacterized protein n=1 Tax=Hevea brasiliensis TaxID=3981 RepID=A0A6A6KMT5_HEVBR|nr:hypothetical protein GH714_007849 [Hevea brasiliensis]
MDGGAGRWWDWQRRREGGGEDGSERRRLEVAVFRGIRREMVASGHRQQCMTQSSAKMELGRQRRLWCYWQGSSSGLYISRASKNGYQVISVIVKL